MDEINGTGVCLALTVSHSLQTGLDFRPFTVLQPCEVVVDV